MPTVDPLPNVTPEPTPTPEPMPSGGGIDTALVGRWWRLTTRTEGREELTFSEDGAFSFQQSYRSGLSAVMFINDVTAGNYRIDETGNVLLYNLVCNPGTTNSEDVPNMTLSYSFTTNNSGETFLNITQFNAITGTVYEDGLFYFHKG
ncbi:MAG: hypothetical protein FWH01_15910 [Oscillospiraceae bacterium]|nr:hypothetical protein [Oscillospiraceae bacterium]